MPGPSSALPRQLEYKRQRETDRAREAEWRPAKVGLGREGTASGIECVLTRWDLLEFCGAVCPWGGRGPSKTDAEQRGKYMRVKRLSKTFRSRFDWRSIFDDLPIVECVHILESTGVALD